MGEADLNVFSAIVQSTFDMAETSISIVIYLIGIMTLWLGIMKVGEAGGAVNLLSRMVAPFFRKLFPELPKDHPAMGSMMMNFSANMLGLDNAATPLGLKAMEELQTLDKVGFIRYASVYRNFREAKDFEEFVGTIEEMTK